MNKRKLGRTNLHVSELCLNTAKFGFVHDEASSFELLDTYYTITWLHQMELANAFELSVWMGKQGGRPRVTPENAAAASRASCPLTRPTSTPSK